MAQKSRTLKVFCDEETQAALAGSHEVVERYDFLPDQYFVVFRMSASDDGGG